jgi:hypothetical protein
MPGSRKIRRSSFPFIRSGKTGAIRDQDADLTVMKSFLKSVLPRFVTRNDKLVFGVSPSKGARKVIKSAFLGAKFEICCRHDPAARFILKPKN